MTITINLTEPRGSFTFELAIPFAGVVPGDTPKSNQTKNPPPGAGRYMIRNVRDQPRLRDGQEPELLAEPRGHGGGRRQGRRVRRRRSTARRRTRSRASRGTSLDFMVDNPPADRIAELKSKYEGTRFREFPTPSTFYFFMNTETPPFDDLKVRQAVNYAVDPDAINRVQGGVIAPQNEFLPQAVPGYEDTPDLYPHDLEQGEGADQGGRRRGRQGHGLGQPGEPDQGDGRVLRGRAERDRPRRRGEDHRRLDVLRDARGPRHQGADRLVQLVPGLPAPGGLPRRAPEPGQRQRDREHQRPVQRQATRSWRARSTPRRPSPS